ncbi:MAG TPA: hypothetical protein VGM41_21975 [Chitinophagaceae bacterium]|jgi:hypothetical protein
MKLFSYKIAFDFTLDNSTIVIPLTAKVELHHSTSYYVISNFQTLRKQERTLFPDLKIRKKFGTWVHIDSEKETHLSETIGKAIEKHEQEHPPRLTAY